VIVEPAGAHNIQVARQLRLPWRQEADLVDGRTVGVFGMWIRFHVVRPEVVVGERHPRSRSDGQRFR